MTLALGAGAAEVTGGQLEDARDGFLTDPGEWEQSGGVQHPSACYLCALVVSSTHECVVCVHL